MNVLAVVDDDALCRAFVRQLAEHAGFAVEEYSRGDEFLERYRPKPGCVVLEWSLLGKNGLQVLAEMKERGWTVPVIMTTGRTGEAGPFLDAGAMAFVEKPFRVSLLLGWMLRAASAS